MDIYLLWLWHCFDSSSLCIRSRGTAVDKKQWPFYSKWSQVNCHSISAVFSSSSICGMDTFIFLVVKYFFFRSHSHSNAVCRELNTNANGVLFNVSLCLANHSFVSVVFFSYPFSDLHHIFLLMTTRCGESAKWTFIIYTLRNHLIVVVRLMNHNALK